jgi:hypothetical protein
MVIVMKSMCCVFFGLLLYVSTSRAEDRIEFSADAVMSTCVVSDAPGLVRVHMFHTGSLPAAGVFFFAPTPPCWVGATWLGDIIVSPWLPGYANSHSPNGLAVTYQACVQPPIYLGYMNFLVSGQALPCCEYHVIAPTGSPGVVGVSNCDLQTYRVASTRPAIINGNSNCPCESPLSTAETTWGRVKALYR